MWKRYMLVVLVLCTAWVLSASTGQAQDTSNILILNSYNESLPWTNEQSNGIIGAFRRAGLDSPIFVEYLDWKNNPTGENLAAMYTLLKTRYESKKIDLVMATDDAALEFALKHRRELFSGAPVVFSGIVPMAADRLLTGEKNVTGVYENLDIEGTIRLMVSLQPDLQQIYLIFDNTESGSITWVPVEMAAPRIKQGLAVLPINYLSHEEIARTIGEGSGNTAVLITTYSRDINGRIMEPERWVKYFCERSKAPVYILFDYQSGYGAVGGSVLSGKLQGEAAADLALKILRGVRADDIPPVNAKDSVMAVDYKQLVKYGLPAENVPMPATFFNRPRSALEENWPIIWTSATIFMAMGVYILLLINTVRQRFAAEAALKARNDELAALNEEMTASQEELQAQYESLGATQRALSESEERYKLSLAGANDGLWDWDIINDEMFFSDRCIELLGIEPHKGGIRGYLSHMPRGERRKVIRTLRHHFSGLTEFYACEYRVVTPTGVRWLLARGKALFDGAGRAVRMAGSLTDVSERKKNEDEIEYLAYHDSLTGLANRAAFNERLSAVLAATGASGRCGAMVFIDLDNFKAINDTFGHTYGDKLLVRLSLMLGALDGGDHFIARVGGDEFIVLLDAVADAAEAADYADKIMAMFSKPLVVDTSTLYVTGSAGITLFPADGTTKEVLFKNADLAMYKAKELGKNRYVFFDQAMDEAVRNKMMLEQDLREAVEKGEFRLWYQPLIEGDSGKIKGFEALIRWNKGSRTVMPGDFIKAAEETGLIVPIGDFVFRSACAFAAGLSRRGYADLAVTVNLSVVQLMRSDFSEWIAANIKAAGVEPFCIGLEITESVLMDSLEANVEKLEAVRRLGVKIYLDDFGTGYSSLRYLRQLPVDVIKIDKSFTDDIGSVGDDKELAGSIIALIHQAGLRAVAEGVENEHQMARLKKYGCDLLQGYLFSKPVPEEEVPSLLARFL